MLAAIERARRSVRFEFYTVTDSRIGRAFRDALATAAGRGVAVQALVDAVGSFELPRGFFDPIPHRGGRFRWFNPLRLGSWTFRNHRKLLIVDEQEAFVGGCNLDDAYDGDGVRSGWRDLGLSLTGPLVRELVASHDEMFEGATLRAVAFRRGEPAPARGRAGPAELLSIRPGFGVNPLHAALRADLGGARDVILVTPYFLPSVRLRRAMARTRRRGGRVRLLLPGASDVPLAQAAARSLYRRLLRRGLEIYEYQPQILHAKLLLLDETVYVGSSNLDPRSLAINFEIMLRLRDAKLAACARQMLEADLGRSVLVRRDTWRAGRTWWRRLRGRIAWWILARADVMFARTRLRRLH